MAVKRDDRVRRQHALRGSEERSHGRPDVVGPPVFSLLSSDDLFLFNQGTHYRLYQKLGSHVIGAGQQGAIGVAPAAGTYFAVWAPSAGAVSVVGDWNSWRPGANPLHVRESSGIWEGLVPNVGHGTRYKYALVAPDGRWFDKADPFATRSEHPPCTASIIWEPHHRWEDGEWMRTRGPKAARTAPMSIYEVHLGSWRGDRGAVLGYRELGRQLAEHVTQLGFTHIELMPVMEHPFYGSWGYQVTGYFAPTTRYGAPDDFMAMIDELHRRDVGVIMDWVPAHFPTDAHGLGEFDGTHLYEHADPRRGFHPDWTSYIFNYGRPRGAVVLGLVGDLVARPLPHRWAPCGWRRLDAVSRLFAQARRVGPQ